jgi:hypothetical protein
VGSFVSSTIVINGLLSAAPFVGSLSLLFWGSAVVQTRGLPAALGYLVITAGLLRLLSFFVASGLGSTLNLVQLLLNIIWGLWLGAVLLQGG